MDLGDGAALALSAPRRRDAARIAPINPTFAMQHEHAPEWLENTTFDELQPGASARLTRKLTEADISAFAAISGDLNPTRRSAHSGPIQSGAD